MGKKKQGSKSQLGKAIIRDRFGGGRSRKHDGSTQLHTSELQDGYDWGRLNLQSVTEQSNLDEFLATAELAGTEFTAEKLNISFVRPNASYGVLNPEEKRKVKEVQESHRSLLKIPRRPKWDRTTSPEELEMMEREAFMKWRKDLAELQEVEGITLTLYEKNLEFWRQLWRVVERSDIVVQIVDARNPLLFRSEDLEHYVKDIDSEKMNMILVNKGDYLTESQREAWARYFDSLNLPVAFFSALQETQVNQAEKLKIVEEDEEEEEEEEVDEEEEDEEAEEEKDEEPEVQEEEEQTHEDETEKVPQKEESKEEGPRKNSSKLISRDELIHLFKTLHKGRKFHEGRATVGLVGYPNVGKSSTINCLLNYKKVSVSATPGKTKHFQTLLIDDELMLCDCPGLVMPSFVSTKHDMVVWGILPIDQMRDHVGPVNVVASMIPRNILEATYGIFIPKPAEGEDPNRPPSSEELLNAYGFMRGFMTARGLPDNPRSSRHVLKDFVNGKLLYCIAPPGVPQEEYHKFVVPVKRHNAAVKPTPQQLRVTSNVGVTTDKLDKIFFTQSFSTSHAKGRGTVPANPQGQGSSASSVSGSMMSINSASTADAKPWKKHNKKNKREKLRRVYSHLDQ